MRKLVALVVALMGATVLVIAGNSGVSDPTISLTDRSPAGGKERHDIVKASFDSLDTAVEAVIDELDSITDGSGNFSNNTAAVVASNLTLNGTALIAGAVTLTTDLTVPNGGSGESTFTDGGVLLGSGTSPFTAMAVLTDGQMIVGDGTSDPVAESGATLRTSIGVGTTDSPQFTGIELGAATDNTITRPSAGDIAIENNIIYRLGGTDVAVADGGTGLGSGTSGGVLGFTASGTIASSALLTQYGPIIGGGAGVLPSAIAVGVNNQVLKGATGAAPAFGALVDADVPDDITISDANGALVSSNLTLYGTLVAPNDALDPADLAGGTLPADVVSAEFTVDGKYAAVGPDATTGLMLQTVSGTTSADGSVTQLFTVAFGAAPVVTWDYTEDPGVSSSNWVGTVTASNVIIHGAASKTWAGIAVGTRP